MWIKMHVMVCHVAFISFFVGRADNLIGPSLWCNSTHLFGALLFYFLSYSARKFGIAKSWARERERDLFVSLGHDRKLTSCCKWFYILIWNCPKQRKWWWKNALASWQHIVLFGCVHLTCSIVVWPPKIVKQQRTHAHTLTLASAYKLFAIVFILHAASLLLLFNTFGSLCKITVVVAAATAVAAITKMAVVEINNRRWNEWWRFEALANEKERERELNWIEFLRMRCDCIVCIDYKKKIKLEEKK